MDIKEYISSGIIESYVLGLASEQEISLLECVRKNHPEVEAAILEAQATMEDVTTVQAITPPVHLKDDIWNKINSATEKPSEHIATSSAEEVETMSASEDKVIPLATSRWTRLSIAAAALLAVSIGANIYLYKSNKDVQDTLVDLDFKKQLVEQQLASATEKWDLISKPAVKSVQLLGTEGHADLQARVLWDTERKMVYLIADQLPKAPEGRQYQLWALVDGQPVDAGMVPLADDTDMHAMHTIASAQAFAITLEKVGGSPVPTLSELRVIGNI